MSTGWLFGYGDGNRVTEDEVRRRPSWVPFYVGYGGGTNSTAVLVNLVRSGLRPDGILFADTRGEKPETYAFLPRVDEWLHRHGFPTMTIVVNQSPVRGDVSLEARCLRNQTMPSLVFGGSSCSMAWKIEPQEKWTNGQACAQRCWGEGEKVVKAIGYHADEEHRSAKAEDEKYRYWYPLREWAIGQEGCESMIAEAGLPLPPKSACFFCPATTTEEIVWLADTHPDLYERALEIERGAVKAMDEEADKTERETGTRPTRTVVGLGRHWTWESVIRMTYAQRAKLPKPPKGCVRCTDRVCETEAA